MNIEEIKRNLNLNRLPDINKTTESQVPVFHPEPSRNEEKRPLKEKHNIVNFDDSEEEEVKPQSEIWNTELEDLDITQPIKSIVSSLDLENVKYDWRYKTKKGVKSRKNFTAFLIDVL